MMRGQSPTPEFFPRTTSGRTQHILYICSDRWFILSFFLQVELITTPSAWPPLFPILLFLVFSLQPLWIIESIFSRWELMKFTVGGFSLYRGCIFINRSNYSNTTVYYGIHERSECIPVDSGVTNFNSLPTFSPYLHNTVCSGETSHNPLLRLTPGLFTLEWTHRATFAWLQAWNQHNYDGHAKNGQKMAHFVSELFKNLQGHSILLRPLPKWEGNTPWRLRRLEPCAYCACSPLHRILNTPLLVCHFWTVWVIVGILIQVSAVILVIIIIALIVKCKFVTKQS